MKKSLLALAVLGAFAGAASAQSSVTIYGSLDLSLAKTNNTGSGYAPNPGAPSTNAYTVQQSNSSRLGFRGNEDIGGGLSAQFQIEHRFTPDDGLAANPFWAGRSYVQLTSAAAGSVYLGREYTPAFWPAVKSDPFGWDGVGQMGSAQWSGYLNPGGVRSANTIGYKSPNLGGLTVQAATALSESSGTGRTDGFNIEYGAGPLYAAMGYEKIKGGAADKQGTTNFAVHYNFGVAKVMGYYDTSKYGTAGATKSKMFSLGVLAPIGPGNLKAAYYRVNPDGANNNRSKLGVGYDYYLSKRTNVYADLGNARADGLKNNTAWAFGLKHTF